YYANQAPVSGAQVELQGPIPAAALTDATGAFAFGGLDPARQQLTPHKSGELNDGISALDAAFILQALVGTRSLDAQQQLACDVSGNGAVSALDAALILQFLVGTSGRFPAAQRCDSDWLFVPTPALVPNQVAIPPQLTANQCQPGALAYQPALSASASNQDFLGILLGDCTGNWRPSSAASSFAAALAAPSEPALRLGRLHRTRPDRLQVPIYSATPAAALSALSFRMRYDATALRVTGVRRFGRARAGMLQFNAQEPGVVAVAWASAAPIASGNQPLLTIQFEPRSPASALGSPLELIEARREGS